MKIWGWGWGLCVDRNIAIGFRILVGTDDDVVAGIGHEAETGIDKGCFHFRLPPKCYDEPPMGGVIDAFAVKMGRGDIMPIMMRRRGVPIGPL